MKKSVGIFLSLVITLLASYYQRKHGPTRPLDSIVSIADTSFDVRLQRSFDQGSALVELPATTLHASAILIYRPYPTDYGWDTIAFEHVGTRLRAELPVQRPAAKLSYWIQYKTPDGQIDLFRDHPVIVRFRGNVPAAILVPHVLFMFAFMFFSNFAAISLAINKRLSVRWVGVPVLMLFFGGLVFGPLVQKYAFNEYWTGIPFGWDLTDNKTLVAFIAWLVAFSLYRRRQRAGWVYVAAIVTLAVFSIPHSLLGSELNYETGNIETGWLLLFIQPGVIKGMRIHTNGVKTKLLLLLSILFTVSASYGQTTKLTGKVQDRQTGEPLIGAHVVVSGTGQVTIAGKDGVFELFLDKGQSSAIEVSYFGYETYRDSTHSFNDELVIIKLKSQPIDLNAVTITSSRTTRLLRDVPELTQIISAQQIEKIDAVNLQETLELMVPGIDFSPNSHGANITLNGLNNRYVLILIDGERLAGEINGNQDLRQISTSNVERIEIVKGAASTMYGSSAIGGVINIITQKPFAGIEATGAVQFSKYNNISDNASIDFRNKKFYSSSRFNSQYSDGYDLTPTTIDDPDGGELWTQDRFLMWRFEQALGWEPSDKFQLSSKTSYYCRNVYPPKKEGVLNPDPYYERFDNIGQQFRLLRTYGQKGSTIEGAGNFSQYSRFFVYPKRTNSEVLENKNRLMNIRVVNTSPLTNWQTLSAGVEYSNDYLSDNRTGIDSVAEDELVVFGRDEIVVWQKHRLVTGARFTWHSAYGTHLNPQVSYMFQMPSSALRLSYSRGFRAPTLKELHMDFYHQYGGLNFRIEGNPGLQPEESDYYSMAYDITYGRFYMAANVYYNHIRNIIVEDFSNFQQGYVVYRNQDEANISGLEMNSTVRLPFHISVMGSYSFLYAIDDKHKQLHNTYRHAAKLNVDYSYQKHQYWLNINLNGKYIGDKYVNDSDELEGVFNTYTVPAYFLWKLTVNNRFEYWKKYRFTLTYGIDNMFNYINTLDFGSINPGRQFFISLKINFKSYK